VDAGDATVGSGINHRALVWLAVLLATLWMAAGLLAGRAHQQRNHRSEALGREGARALQEGRPERAVSCWGRP
jgi:hypothetical protein